MRKIIISIAITLVVSFIWVKLGLYSSILLLILLALMPLTYIYRGKLFSDFDPFEQLILVMSSSLFLIALMVSILNSENSNSIVTAAAVIFMVGMVVLATLASRAKNSKLKFDRLKLLKSVYAIFNFVVILMLFTHWYKP